MAGVEGTGSVQVIPQVRTIILSPSTLTLRVGDTASIRSTVITVDGDTLQDNPVVWRESDFGAVAAAMFYGTGPPASTVALAKAVGENTITMQVATSRQDSVSNVRGTVRITVLPSTSGLN
jgi:saccharopine dehydrogenase-like NADP-dependent oxidoreductase